MFRPLSLCTVVLLALTPTAYADEALKVAATTTEYRINPIGLDVAQPRMAWKLSSPAKDVRQTAYQITVWDDKRSLWDSGKKMSNESTQIAYGGKPLRSGQKVQWHVQVWDNHGATATSETATWEMGRLSRADWSGQWISAPQKDGLIFPVNQQGLYWIWYPEGNPAILAPNATRHFRRKFALPKDAEVTGAVMGCVADSRAEIRLNGNPVGNAPGFSMMSSFDIKGYLLPGDNLWEMSVSNGGDAGGVLAQLQVQFKGGQRLIISTDKAWDASREPNSWVPALQAAPAGQGKLWKEAKTQFIDLTAAGPAAQFRTTFATKKKVVSARLYATALGIYEAEINGRKVGQDLFAPGWTDYNKRVQYQVYDVTDLINEGPNALGAYLSEGWYAGKVGFTGRRLYGREPKFLANLVLHYADGKQEVISTGPKWKQAVGPIVQADLQDGENFDARQFQAAWSTPQFDDSSWKPVNSVALTSVKAALVAEQALPVRAFETRLANSVTQPKPGVFVYDFGQNMPGFGRISAKSPSGTTVTLRFAEVLNTDGTLYTDNLRTAKATDSYTFAGLAGGETWQPRFTVHGFRYAEITGWPTGSPSPTKDTLQAIVVHSDIPKTGSFKSSSKMVNQLVSNIDWGQRGNFLSVPTDCPQRDERLGWMGDAQIFARTAARNRDVAAFFTKWLTDVRDAQSPQGAFSDVAPRAGGTGDSSPAWGDAGVIVPWVMFQEYGDKQLLAASYASMVKWIELIRRNNPNLLWDKAQGASFGDWLSIAADTDKSVLATAFFAYSTDLVSQSAAALGKEADTRTYAQLAEQIRKAFVKAYVDADGRIKSDTQTAYVLALRFDMLPENLRAKATEHLVQNIQAHGNHLNTGFLGVGHLLPALTRFGQLKTAYTLLNNDTFPSWGYSIKYGATTIWERWDGWTDDKGFQSPGMNSFNHYSLGSVGEWLYETVSGISPAMPGYKRIRIAPQPGGGLTEAAAELETPYGKVKSAWSIKKGELRLSVQVPPNTDALVVVPGVLLKAPREATVGAEPNAFSVGSGSYEFTAKVSP